RIRGRAPADAVCDTDVGNVACSPVRALPSGPTGSCRWRFRRLRHPPLAEPATARARTEANQPEVAVVARRVMVVGPAADDRHILRGGHDFVPEVPGAGSVFPAQPVANDRVAPAPGLVERSGVIDGVL